MNLEVTKRDGPCAFFADPDRWNECRWCDQLTHVKIQHGDKTLCAHDTIGSRCWIVLSDTHPEDVNPMQRCQICYQAVEKIKRAEANPMQPRL